MLEILKTTGLNRKLLNQKLSIQLIRPFCFFDEVVPRLAKHNSPETIFHYQNIESNAWSGVKGNGTVCGEAADRAGSRAQTLTLSSAHTGSQPRQSHCSDEAVWTATRDSEQTLDQVAEGEVRVAGSCSVSGLCEVAVEWYPQGNSNPCCTDENRVS